METLRHFAREQAQAEDLEGLRRRHARHYAAFAEQAGAGMRPSRSWPGGPVAAEMDNLRAATGWAFAAPALEDMVLGVKVTEALIGELLILQSSGIQALATAALPRVDQLSVGERSVVLIAAAHDAFQLGQLDRARELGA